MPIFDYVGKTPGGETVTGNLKAVDEEKVGEFLKARGLAVVSVNQRGGGGILSRIPLIGGSGVSQKDLLIFTKYFCILVKAGIPVLKSMKILMDQNSN